MRLGTCVSQTSACSAGVPGGPKTGGMPLVPPTCRAETKDCYFSSGVFSLLALLVELHNRTATAEHV